MTNETFSRNLRQLRIDKNLTQEQLAGTLGVSAQCVSRWECGNTLPDVMFSARKAQQKIALQCDLGKGREEAAKYDHELEENPSNPQTWLLCTAAHYMAGEHEKALEVVLKGMKRFPNHAALLCYAGDICRAIKRYDEAFSYWKEALDADNTFLDAAYSMGFCHEEMGQYAEAYKVWKELAQALDRRGLVVEKKWPEEMAENCLKKLK